MGICDVELDVFKLNDVEADVLVADELELDGLASLSDVQLEAVVVMCGLESRILVLCDLWGLETRVLCDVELSASRP